MEKPGMLAFKGFFIYFSVHWNARMAEMQRSGIEVILVFADNVPSLQKYSIQSSWNTCISEPFYIFLF